MIDHVPPVIAPPPSIDDILSAGESRIGLVDFTAPLATETEPDRAPAKPVVRTQPKAPVADQTEDPHAQAAQLVATSQDETDVEPDPDNPDEPAIDLADQAVESEPVSVPVPVPNAPATPPGVPDDELDELVLSVQRVADSVIMRMREAGESSRRHLEATAAEASRRCELLTAQAELDAELIRLHARREAHAIITAARVRTGAGTGWHEDSQRLNQIGETFSRFAESLETTVASTTGTPETPQKP